MLRGQPRQPVSSWPYVLPSTPPRPWTSPLSLTVTLHYQAPSHSYYIQLSLDSYPTKLPIPRLRPTPTPQPQPVPIIPDLPSPFPTTLTKGGRPKTSHTTIERRYRTNLNARILALKRAVPALRILEKANGASANANAVATQGKGMTGACVSKWDFSECVCATVRDEANCPLPFISDDVVNERGYVDGVKAAKKNSKGVVLGKAVEYIKYVPLSLPTF